MMFKIVTVEEMRAIEAAGDAAGVSYAAMMDNAGRALADRVLDLLAGQAPVRITVLVGSGNNGGDALVAGRLIAQESDHEVQFYLYKARDKRDPVFAAVQKARLPVMTAAQDEDYQTLASLIAASQIVIDGILGIGLTLPVKGNLASMLEAAKQAIQTAKQQTPISTYATPDTPSTWTIQTPYVIAVDCPSGLDCDTGAVDDLTIPADETVTFAAAKRGQVLFPGGGMGGTLHIADIGLPADLPALHDIPLVMPTGADIRAMLPKLPADAHKGTFGKVMSVAGSLNYTGAAALAAEAAYRAGAGLVTAAAPQPIVPILAAQMTEATWLLLPHDMGVIAESAAELVHKELANYSALLMGPGWGRESCTRDFLQAMLNNEQQADKQHRIGFAPTAEASAENNEATDSSHLPPLIVDADGLNLLSEIDAWWNLLPANTVLTPHPGEMARLTGLERAEVQAQRLPLAQEKAAEWDCIVLLKGAYTVIAAPDGQTCVLPFAEPALATAGTGDILAGAIAGLLAQGTAPFEAAVAAGYLHGLAGRLVAEGLGTARSITAQDVLLALPEAVSTIEHAI
jgi:hydroxyethylthiazole kinase-like uncharacterized protein yjeF